MRDDICIFALSVNPDELTRRLINSLYGTYTLEEISSYNFQVVCQGYPLDLYNKLCATYPEITFYYHDRVEGTISTIRDTLTKEYGTFDKYRYVVLIDDDFKYGQKAFEQYDYYFSELDNNPKIGLVALHRRMKTSYRLQISPLELPYPHDLGAISMRNGLIVRTEAIPETGLFSPDIIYHEEMYLAMQIYLNGYDVAKGWIDIYHKANNLGYHLQQKYNFSKSNEAMSSKKKAYDLGLFDIEEGRPFYDGQDCGNLNSKAISIHDANQKRRFPE